jgi:hypothetical protein
MLNMESVYHIVAIRVIETSWAHVWRLRSRYFGMGYDSILEYYRSYFHLHDFYISDNPKVELTKLLGQLERSIISTSN